MTGKTDFLLSITGSITGTILSESNLLLSYVVYIITGLYTSVKLYHFIKDKRNGIS